MRLGICTAVYEGDMIAVDGGVTKLRYYNVWAPSRDTELGEAVTKYNQELVLGKEIEYESTGYIHSDHISIVSEVYVNGLWVNQEIRYWLAKRMPQTKEQWAGFWPST